MTSQPTLSTSRLILRPFTGADAGEVQHLAGAAAVADTTLSIPHPYESGLAESWIATHQPAFSRQENVVFAITDKDSRLVGAINLRLELKHSRGEVGYWIGEPYWGHGYATEAVIAVLRYGLADLGLNRIYARHFARNPASGRVMQKAGMRHEGHERQHVLKSGRFEDLECYAIVRADRP